MIALERKVSNAADLRRYILSSASTYPKERKRRDMEASPQKTEIVFNLQKGDIPR